MVSDDVGGVGARSARERDRVGAAAAVEGSIRDAGGMRKSDDDDDVASEKFRASGESPEGPRAKSSCCAKSGGEKRESVWLGAIGLGRVVDAVPATAVFFGSTLHEARV